MDTRLGMGCCGSKSDVDETAHQPLRQPAQPGDKCPKTPQTPPVSSPNSSETSTIQKRGQGLGALEENEDTGGQENGLGDDEEDGEVEMILAVLEQSKER